MLKVAKISIPLFLIVVALVTSLTVIPPAAASDVFIGQIVMMPTNFEPRAFAYCEGQLLPISQNTALFSLLGTTFGGDGRTVFGLPNIQGRVPIHQGRGPGLSSYRLGQIGGLETVTLSEAQMPAHLHEGARLKAYGDVGNTDTPAQNTVLARDRRDQAYSTQAPNVDMRVRISVLNEGGSQSHPNMPPYLPIGYVIALQGIYPSRS